MQRTITRIILLYSLLVFLKGMWQVRGWGEELTEIIQIIFIAQSLVTISDVALLL